MTIDTNKISSVVTYSTDFTNGSSLNAIWHNVGWVEFLQQKGKVYYCKHPKAELYNTIRQYISRRFVELFDIGDKDRQNLNDIGLTQYLADERLKNPFALLPMAATENNKFILQTGVSRLSAELLCGTPLSDIALILYVPASDTFDFDNNFHNHREIVNTTDYENILSLVGTDYRITLNLEFHSGNKITFKNTVLRHTIYDFTEGEKTNQPTQFVNQGERLLGILKRFRDDEGKVALHFSCTEAVSRLLPAKSDRFKITYKIYPDEEWAWSYGRILAQAHETGQHTIPRIHIWLFGITEPVTEEILLMMMLWTSYNYTAYHTKDKKCLVFKPGSIDKLYEVGNFVK